MSFHVRDNFTAGPVSQVPASWFNSVASFLNNLCGGLGIRVMRDATPPQVSLDVEKAKEALAIPSVCPNAVMQDGNTGDTQAEVAARAPAEVEQVYTDATGDPDTESDSDKIARIGASKFAARADHIHRDPIIHQTRQTLDDMFYIDPDSELLYMAPPVFDPGGRFIGLSDDDAYAIDIPLGNINPGVSSGVLYADNGSITTRGIGTSANQVAAGNHNHNSDYAAKNHNHNGVYQPAGTVPGHTHSVSEITGMDGAGFLTDQDIGSTVQSHSAKLDALESALNSSGKVPLSQLTGNISGHSGTCYVTIDNNGNLGHSENMAFKLLDDAKSGADQNTKLIRSIDLGDGLTFSSNKAKVKCNANGGLTVDSNGIKMNPLHSSAPSMAGMLTCTSDGDGGHWLRFYPPIVDVYGRITGLSTTAAWQVDLMDNV